MQAAHDELVRQKIVSGALRTGDLFPSFSLVNQKNESRTIEDLFGESSFLVISFYRGGWCPYCNLELKALQTKSKDLKSLNTLLVAISPERPDHSLTTAEKNSLAFEVLSDEGSQLSKQLGISFELPESLKPIYAEFGINIPEHNGKDNFTLPVPASYIVDRKRQILYDYIDIDYRVRADPEEIVTRLKKLSSK